MAYSTNIEPFINKSVRYRFAGSELRFHLSQSLFSSFNVDEGTRLLLKSIAQEVDLGQASSALDVGCGVGVIGISLKKSHPHLDVSLEDRDALALAFTAANAQLNAVDVQLAGGLGLQDERGGQYDLIVSNLPGKAGLPVLRDMIRRIPGRLSNNGRAAIVVVKPLESSIREALQESQCELLYSADSSGYTVLHFAGGGERRPYGPSLSPYVRGRFPFHAGNSSWQIQAVYNIPEFDTLGRHTTLAMNVLRKIPVSGRALFWNAGQGHFPVFLAGQDGGHISEYFLASRDSLSLQISALNLQEAGIGRHLISQAHLPHFLALDETFDCAILFPDRDPGVHWDRLLLAKAEELLAPGGRLLLTAKSAFVHRVLTAKGTLRAMADKKRHGFRAVLLEKLA